MPTRTDITNWKPEKLSEWATELETDTQLYETQLARMLIHFQGTTWAGAAYDAAADRFVEEHDQGRRLSQEVRDAATALRAADGRLANERRVLLGKVSEAENDASCPVPLKVADNWVVSSARTSGDTLTGEQRQTVIDKVNAHQATINAAYYSLTGAVSEVGVAITTANQAIRVRGDLLGDGIDAPTEDSKAADLGTEDGKALTDYLNTHPESARDPAVLDRIASQLPTQTLTEEQLRILSQGGTVDSLPTEVQEYYRNLYQTAGSDGILALSEHLATAEDSGNTVAAAQRDALANGMMVISNENIGTGRNPDGTLTNPGSYQNLPSGIRDLIEAKRTDPNPINPNVPGGPAVALQEQWQDTNDLADLMGQANPGYEPGQELGTNLIVKSSDMIQDQFHPQGRDEAAAQFLDIGTRNDDSSHQIWSGDGMPEGYKPRETVQGLLYYDWPESAQGSPTVLLDRVSEEAQLPVNTERGDRGRADLAALGSMFSSTDDAAAWENTRQEFAGNPELANKVSQMVSSNLDSVSSRAYPEGYPGDSKVLDGVARWNGEEGNRLMELGSYTEEGRVGLTTAVEQHRLSELTEAMQKNPENPASILAGSNAGTLSGRLDDAMWDAIIGEDKKKGEDAISAEEENLLRRAKMMGADMAGMLVDEGVAKIPGSQVVQDVTGLEAGNTTSGLIQEWIGKPEYDFKDRPNSQELKAEANQSAQQAVLNAADAAGQLPEYLKVDGRPATVEEIIDQGKASQLDDFLTEHGLNQFITDYRQSYALSVGVQESKGGSGN
ncbi:TPR repeat region-containing protein [Nocardia sp. MW-W600-9]